MKAKFTRRAGGRRPLSIRSWLNRSFIIFTLAMLVILWVLQTVFLDTIYKAITTSQIKEIGAEISAQMFSDDLPETLDSIVSEQQLCAMVVDSHGRLVSSADTLPQCSIHRMSSLGLFYLYAAASQNGGSYLMQVGGDADSWEQSGRWGNPAPVGIPVIINKESIIYVRIVENAGGQERILLLNSVVTPLNATVQTIRYVLVAVTAVMLVIGACISAFLSRRIANPVIRINRSARELPQGNYTPYDGPACREIKELDGTMQQVCQELGQVEQLRRDLIANVSHDLRTPLTLITGYAEVMRDLPGENTPENVQIIIDEANHLTELVNDLLDLSKLQAGTVTIQPERFNLTGLIRETIGRFSKMTAFQGYKLSLEAGADAWVEADRTRITQVVYNLLGNALHYAGDSREILVRQTVEAGEVKVEVIDHGEGIPADKLPLVWDRYYKIDRVHRRSAVGTGLGLSIVRSVLELHHARYGVESEVGKGSDFWFALPAIPAQLPK